MFEPLKRLYVRTYIRTYVLQNWEIQFIDGDSEGSDQALIPRLVKIHWCRPDTVRIWRDLLISNTKADLYHYNANTKFDENLLIFIQVIVRNQKTWYVVGR